jgi:hypothetical protein
MKIITRQSLANGVPACFRMQYGGGSNPRWAAIIEVLNSLVAPIDPDAVDRAIGNTSWTSVPSCDECNASGLPCVIEMGQPPDYESNTAYLCHACITAAAIALSKVSS